MKKPPKRITLRFLQKHFDQDATVFEFWNENFAINNQPLFRDFIVKCWKKMKPIRASFVVEKIINLYLDEKLKKLYQSLNNNIGKVGNKYKEWQQIDLIFVDFLIGEK